MLVVSSFSKWVPMSKYHAHSFTPPVVLSAWQRAGNALMSFNNRPATDSIPFLTPFIAPSARFLGPVLEQMATSPFR